MENNIYQLTDYKNNRIINITTKSRHRYIIKIIRYLLDILDVGADITDIEPIYYLEKETHEKNN